MSNTYCTQSDIEATFGTQNVARWAKLADSDSSATISARITRAIEVASEEIEDMLRYAGMDIPCEDPDGVTPKSVEQLCADLAGVWLYESRGVDDVDPQGNPRHKLQYHVERAQKRLREIADRKRKINTRSNTG